MAESFDNVRISKFQNPFAGDKMMFDDGAAALSFSIKKSLVKVQLFWEGHKNVRNRPYGFEIYLVNDCANFCGLLRKAELYMKSSL